MHGELSGMRKISPDGQSLIVSMKDDNYPGTCLVKNKLFHKINDEWIEQEFFNNCLFDFEFSSDGTTLWFRGSDEKLYVTKKQDNVWVPDKIEISDNIANFKISSDNTLLVVGNRNGELIIFEKENDNWRKKEQPLVSNVSMRKNGFLNFELLPGGKVLVLIVNNQGVKKLVMFEKKDGQWTNDPKVLIKKVYGFDVSVDGSTIAVQTSAERFVMFENKDSGIELVQTAISDSDVRFFKFSPFSPFLCDNQVLVVELSNKKNVSLQKRNGEWKFMVCYEDRLLYPIDEKTAILLGEKLFKLVEKQKNGSWMMVPEQVQLTDIRGFFVLADKSLVVLRNAEEAMYQILELAPSDA